MSVTLTLEATHQKCQTCEALLGKDAEIETAYECANCGTRFGREESPSSNHQCPNCNKFAAKLDPNEGGICPECNEASTFEDVYVPSATNGWRGSTIITCVCHDEEHEVYV
jgi:ssDNA-binding Zn-finger/Zn-ribbon topoisomerase 1